MASGFGGGSRFYIPPAPLPQPYQNTGNTPTYYQAPAPPPTYTPPSVPTLPPPPNLPPPPTLPTIPSFNPTYLPMFQNLLAAFQNYNALPSLGTADKASLGAMTAAQEASAQQAYTDAADQQLASLFGRGVERSSISEQGVANLAQKQALIEAQIQADAAQRELALRQYMGGQGLNALQAQGGILGQAAGIEGNVYGSNVNALLGLAGLANAAYGTQTGNALNLYGQQSGNLLNLYGQQSQNTLQQQQLAQQQYLAQQQQQQQFLQMIFSMLPQLFSGGMGGTGSTGGLYGGTTSGGGVSAGWNPYYNQNPSAAPISPQQLQQAFYQYLLSYLGGGR